MQPTIVNKFGKISGWNSVRVTVLGRILEGITKVEYNDNQVMANEYGVGSMPIGQSDGNYEATLSLGLYAEEIVGLQESIPPGTRIQDIPPFDITVVYEYGAKIVKDVIKNVKLMNPGKSYQQGDGKSVHDVQCLCSHILWNQ